MEMWYASSAVFGPNNRSLTGELPTVEAEDYHIIVASLGAPALKCAGVRDDIVLMPHKIAAAKKMLHALRVANEALQGEFEIVAEAIQAAEAAGIKSE